MLKKNKLSRNQTGFSLIELMVAVAILAIAAIGIFHAYTNSFQAMADSKYRTVATNLAQQKIEEVKNSIGVAYPFFKQEIISLDGMTYTVNVVAKPPEDDEDANYKEIFATVSWHNRNGIQKDVRLLTLVYDLETYINEDELPEVGRIDLYANPTEMICCLESEISTITAEVFDIDGERAAPSGLPVSFTVINGTLSSEFALTDSVGRATTELTIKGLGPAKVTATTGLVDSNEVEVTCIPAPYEIILSSSHSTVLPGGISTITATIKDSCGNTITSESGEVTVTFTTNYGYFNNDSETTTMNVDTVDGVATINLYMETSGTIANVTGTVTPEVGESFSDSTTVLCTDFSITVTTDYEIIFPSGGNPDSCTITATLAEAGGPVSGESVSFATNIGTLSGQTATTDGNGKASVQLSGLYGGNEATVTATFNLPLGGSISDSVTVKCEQYIIIIQAEPEVITPNRSSEITVTLTDYLSNPAGDRRIEFFTTKGSLSDYSVYTDSSGVARTTLTGLTVGDKAVVTATIGFTSKSASVECIEFILGISAIPTSIISGGTSEITATLTNYLGNAQVGKNIDFITDRGTFIETGSTSATAVTDSRGRAVVHLTLNTSGTTATVTATYGVAKATVSVRCVDTYITLNNPPNIYLYSSYYYYDYVRFDLRLYGGPLTVDKVKVEWETISGNPTRYYQIWIERPIGSTRTEIYNRDRANNGTVEVLNRNSPYTIPKDSTFRVRIRFSSSINNRNIVFTFNPDEPDAENYQVEFRTPRY